MPDICDYCGEYKPVTKIDYNLNMGGNHLVIAWPSYYYNLCCEECYKAKKILANKEREEANVKLLEERRAWIKQRNKLLSDNDKYKLHPIIKSK